ncbi:Serpin B8 [Porphyridium purpureum]|uniref:Serpin B8 n=1 Tax=Porphyridium purpureum TaxID=35688 RepID=A0A5J4YQM8_PORPP|nr:Serpin B8 [Porphyridium purpureum]|eukprot:POR5287..scf236_6
MLICRGCRARAAIAPDHAPDGLSKRLAVLQACQPASTRRRSTLLSTRLSSRPRRAVQVTSSASNVLGVGAVPRMNMRRMNGNSGPALLRPAQPTARARATLASYVAVGFVIALGVTGWWRSGGSMGLFGFGSKQRQQVATAACTSPPRVALADSVWSTTRRLTPAVIETQKGENVVFSGFSAMSAFLPVLLGAESDTLEQLQDGFCVRSKTTATEGYPQLLAAIEESQQQNDSLTLRTANKMFAAGTIPLLPLFKVLTQNALAVVPDTLDVQQPAAEAARINGWVESATAGTIKQLVTSDMITPLTMLVLVNAVYFKGTWRHQFDEGNTKSRPFYSGPSAAPREVPMMHLQKRLALRHASEIHARTCELEYVGGRLSMLIVLPEKRFGLAEVIEALEAFDLPNWLESGAGASERAVNVDLQLPRWKTESTFDLKPLARSALNVRDVFDPVRADLTAMTGARDLYVTHAVQKAFVQVNEQGSEASAATAVVVGLRSAPRPIQPPEPFIVDEPFLFFILDRPSKLVLFSGHVSNPAEL